MSLCIKKMLVNKYQHFFNTVEYEAKNLINAMSTLSYLSLRMAGSKQKLFVLIDEYDNRICANNEGEGLII